MPLSIQTPPASATRIAPRFFAGAQHLAGAAPADLAPAAATTAPARVEAPLAARLAQLSPSCKQHLLAMQRHCQAWLDMANIAGLNPEFLPQVVASTAVLLTRIPPCNRNASEGEVPFVITAAARLTLMQLVDSTEPARCWNEVCEAARLQEEHGPNGPMGNWVPRVGLSPRQRQEQADRRELFYNDLAQGAPAYLISSRDAHSRQPPSLGEWGILGRYGQKIAERTRTYIAEGEAPAAAAGKAKQEYLAEIRQSLALQESAVRDSTLSWSMPGLCAKDLAMLPAPVITAIELRLLRSIGFNLDVDAAAVRIAQGALMQWQRQGLHSGRQADIEVFSGYLVKHIAPWNQYAVLPRCRPPAPRPHWQAMTPSPSPPSPGMARTPEDAVIVPRLTRLAAKPQTPKSQPRSLAVPAMPAGLCAFTALNPQ